MGILTIISTLKLQYNNGSCFYSIDETVLFLLLLSISIITIPFIILGDILFFPIELIIYFIRKINNEKYSNKKYKIKDFINEIMET